MTNPPTRKGAARLQSLTEIAGEMFLEMGYEGVSVEALMARVGGSRRNILAFGGKEGLFITAIEQICADLAAPLRALSLDTLPLPAALTQLGATLLPIAVSPKVLALHRLMIAQGARFESIARKIHQEGHETAVQIAADIFARCPEGQLRAGLLSRDLAEDFVTLLVTGPQLRALTGADTAPEPDRVTRIVALFLNGILQEEEPQCSKPSAAQNPATRVWHGFWRGFS